MSCFGPRIRALARYFTSAFASVKYLSQRPHPRPKTRHKILMTGLNPTNMLYMYQPLIKVSKGSHVQQYLLGVFKFWKLYFEQTKQAVRILYLVCLAWKFYSTKHEKHNSLNLNVAWRRTVEIFLRNFKTGSDIHLRYSPFTNPITAICVVMRLLKQKLYQYGLHVNHRFSDVTHRNSLQYYMHFHPNTTCPFRRRHYEETSYNHSCNVTLVWAIY